MSYKILYDPKLTRKFPHHRGLSSVSKWTAIIIAVVLATVIITRKPMNEKRLSHNLEVTSAAFADMIEDLNAGETMMEAFSDFCVKIIKNESEADC